MKIGDAVNTEDLEFSRASKVMEVPEVIAWTWLTEVCPETPINDREETVLETPLKNWKSGYGVVVAVSQRSNPIFLVKGIKMLGGKYVLWEYE